MRISFFGVEDWEIDMIKDNLKKHELFFSSNPLNLKDLKKIKNTEILSTFIYSKIDKKIIDSLKNLKFISTMSTGFDHIDLAYCKKKNINVSNVPAYGENTVAEHVFALILALSRKLYPSIKQTHENHVFETNKSLRGFDLKGKTLGIIGCGNIGKHVARIGVGFGMNVLVFDLKKNNNLAKNIGFKYTTFNNLLKSSDIISLNLPYIKQTHHLIDKNEFKKMKPTALVINTSRGPIINTIELINALKNNQILGAGLDVLEGESEIKEELEVLTNKFKKTFDFKKLLEIHLLMKMDNVIITPHNAFNSKEALERIINTTLENIESFLKNKPINLVNA